MINNLLLFKLKLIIIQFKMQLLIIIIRFTI